MPFADNHPLRSKIRQTIRRPFLLVALTLLVAVFAVSENAWADVVLLKRGGRVEGVIISETENHVVLKIGGGGQMKILRKKIKKIIKASKQDNEDQAEESKKKFEDDKPLAGAKDTPATDAPGNKPSRPTQPNTKPGKAEVVAATAGSLKFTVKMPLGWTQVATTSAVLNARRDKVPAAKLVTIAVVGQGSIGKFQRQIAQQLKKHRENVVLKSANAGNIGGRTVIRYNAEYKVGTVTQSMYAIFVETGKATKVCFIFECGTADLARLKPEFDQWLNNFAVK